MKKVGITLTKEIEDEIEKIAQYNNMSVTTICGLIVATRVRYYMTQHGIPKFKQQYFEELPKEKYQDVNSSETIDEEKMKELTRIAKTPWLGQ